MPEVTIEIGGKPFTVACQDGEEPYLHTAARMLDTEAQAILSQIGRLPEARMLLMAGLMLADRTAAFEERAVAAEERLARQEKLIGEMRSMPQPASERVEVVPEGLGERLAKLAETAEALAEKAETRSDG